MKRFAALAALLAALAGCATANPDRLPDVASTPVAVSSRSDGLAHAYSPAGSQVYVWGKTAGQAVGSAFGLLGLGIGSVIDNQRNKATVEGREAEVTQRFDGVLSARLAAAGLRVAPERPDSPMVLVPRVELADVEGRSRMLCVVEARYGEPGRKGLYTQRTYFRAVPEPRPLVGTGDGWTDRGGAVLREEAGRCFAWLGDAFAADWQGRFAPGAAPRVRLKQLGAKEPREAALLFEGAGFAVLSGLDADQAAIRSHVFVVDSAEVIR